MNIRNSIILLIVLTFGLGLIAACGNEDTSGNHMMNGTAMPMQGMEGMEGMMNQEMMENMMNGTAMPMSPEMMESMMTTMPMSPEMMENMMNGTAMPMSPEMMESMMTAMPMEGMEGMMPMGQMDDLMFLDGMMLHHQGAVEMATEALEQAKRPEVLTLAQNIIDAQTPEIAELQAWRDEWFPNAPATPADIMNGMNMGDMMTSQDTSIEYDIRFVEAMISHHQGAIHMAAMLKTTTERPELQEFADRVIRDQTAEIEQMEAWLEEWK